MIRPLELKQTVKRVGYDHSTCLHFSKAAQCYHLAPSLYEEIGNTLTKLIGNNPTEARVLEVGCGTGIFTRQLAALWPQSHITAIDVSTAMLDEARKNVEAAERIEWIAADARLFKLKLNEYDLIASSCTFHWILPLTSLFKHLISLLEAKGTLAFSMMVCGTLAELRDLRSSIAPDKPTYRDLPSLDETMLALRASGFEVQHVQTEDYTVEYPNSYDFLRAIKNLGLTGGPLGSSFTLLSRNELAQLCSEYQRRHAASSGQVKAGYRVAYIKAHRAPFTVYQ